MIVIWYNHTLCSKSTWSRNMGRTRFVRESCLDPYKLFSFMLCFSRFSEKNEHKKKRKTKHKNRFGIAGQVIKRSETHNDRMAWEWSKISGLFPEFSVELSRRFAVQWYYSCLIACKSIQKRDIAKNYRIELLNYGHNNHSSITLII